MYIYYGSHEKRVGTYILCVCVLFIFIFIYFFFLCEKCTYILYDDKRILTMMSRVW